MISMRKPAAVVLAAFLIITTFGLTACGVRDKNTDAEDAAALKKKLETKLEAYKTDLQDSSDAVKTNDGMEKYLVNWADSKGVSCSTRDGGTVIMSVNSSEKYKKAAPTVIVCPYDASQFSTYVNPIAISLYLIKNNENTGKLTILFVREEQHRFTGAETLTAADFPDGANVFVLNGSSQGRFSLSSGASAYYHFTQNVTAKSPEYTLTYTISITGLNAVQTSGSSSTNPIILLNEFLADLKSSNIPYELSSFAGGTDDTLMASSANMTITVDSLRSERFLKKLSSVAESFNSDKNGSHPDAKFEYQRTDTPSAVMSSDDGYQFVNFLYTMLDGVYAENESGDPIARNTVTYLSADTSHITIGSTANSLDEAKLKEIRKGQKTLCGLSDAQFTEVYSTPLWANPDSAAEESDAERESDFIRNVSTAHAVFTGEKIKYADSLGTTEAGIVQKLNPNSDIIVVNISENVTEDCAGTLLYYLLRSNESANAGA